MSEKTERAEKKASAPAVPGDQEKKAVPVSAGRKNAQRYEAAELAENAGILFGTRPECVRAALKDAGKTVVTAQEADEIIRKFLRREVR